MTYELAKELKEAGFKQGIGNYLTIAGEERALVYDPTLSELIEACGKDFECLGRVEYEDTLLHWNAYPTDKAYKGECVVDCCGYETGDTPEEAVGRLWLALNKK